MKKLYPALLATALASGIAVPHALSHSTGSESRIVSQCERLPNPERGVCKQCVTRPLKHHYHSDYPPGVRCRPDNGKP